MDLINDESSMSVEDRISNLPDDIIHRVLSFLDMKYVVQTCALSHKWKHIWTSTPNLNLNSRTFRDLSQFAYFVKQLLARRNNRAEVYAVDLTYSGLASAPVVRSIVSYAYLRNARQLIVTLFDHAWYKFPQYLFTSHTLKYLSINQNQRRNKIHSRLPNSALVFPALETLHLENIRFGVDGVNIFSKCVNLKDLTLRKCSMYGLESFSICAPQLLNLKVSESFSFPKVLKVVAPQLKNLTASVTTVAGNMILCFNYLCLSTEGFGSLEKVNFSTSNHSFNKQNFASIIPDLFHVVRNAKLLILDVDIIMCLSSRLDQLVQEPCPFDNLKCLKISNCLKRLKQNGPISSKFTQVKNYLLENSPNVTFIMDLPQVSHKRSRQNAPDDAMPMKVAKLEAKTKQTETIQDQIIANQKTELQMTDQVIANLNADIQMKDQLTANLNANIQMNAQVIVNQNENIQLKDKVNAKAKEMIRRLKSNNIPTQSDVPAPTFGDAMTCHH